MSERKAAFLKLCVLLFIFLLVVLLAGPFVSYLVSPFYRPAGAASFTPVRGFASLEPGKPVKLGFNLAQTNGFLKQNEYHEVWVIKHSGNKATVFSPICPHLGCHYNWHSSLQEFICPCHGSVFSLAGKVLGGPAPRPLDTLPHKIENGRLYVQWETFIPGIPVKKQE